MGGDDPVPQLEGQLHADVTGEVRPAGERLTVRADGVRLDEEPVVSEVAREDDGPVAVEGRADAARDAVLPVDREEAITVDAENERRGGDAREGILDTAAIAADVVGAHRIHEDDVAVRIEPAREAVAVTSLKAVPVEHARDHVVACDQRQRAHGLDDVGGRAGALSASAAR